jgi:PIN domain nuclease of toxin-antitoxin system
MDESCARSRRFQFDRLEPAIAIESCKLPGTFHADPADRMLVATARIKKLTLVTRDARILKYSRQGYASDVPLTKDHTDP